MLKECKLALQVSAPEYEVEIASLLMAGANDLQIAGVVIPGTVSFSVANDGTVTDNCTVTDYLIKRALFTYAASRAQWQEDSRAERFRNDYEIQKAQLMHATGYTDYGEPEEGDDDGET